MAITTSSPSPSSETEPSRSASAVLVFIEAARHARDRGCYGPDLALRERRILRAPYPFAYGSITGTRGEDGDCVDCYVLSDRHYPEGALVECEVVGMLEQHEGEELDLKVLARPREGAAPLEPPSPEELRAIGDFIFAVFAAYPGIPVRLDPPRSRAEALTHLAAARLPGE